MADRIANTPLRCAIYTRKSSEEGLEQDFNSLAAQREACAAFIASQKHEGWRTLATQYDDGGYSGASMERPALQRLLVDIRSGLVDVVVVYKVDRLTRSLADFAKMVEVFDAHGASFVSVTQQFNTTTSMGRLTLNVLLSFAQFEREVTGERIRDKITASKKKGLWMGGWVPIGYDLRDRSLVINAAEAKTVRTIFQLYLALGSVRLVQAELERRQLRTKAYMASTGRRIGGLPFRRGHIYAILSNPLYIGEIDHKGSRHPGRHKPIIDRHTWDAVQAKLRRNGEESRRRSKAKERSLLAGLLFDDAGHRLTATHTVKAGRRYRYYEVLPSAGRSSDAVRKGAFRVPAAEIESLVCQKLALFLTDRGRLTRALGLGTARPDRVAHLLTAAEAYAAAVKSAPSTAQMEQLSVIIERIVIGADAVRIELSRNRLLKQLLGTAVAVSKNDRPLRIEIPVRMARRGAPSKLVIEDGSDPAPNPDPTLIRAIARAHLWWEALITQRAPSIAAIAKREGVTDRYVSQTLQLALLSPTLIEAALDGRPMPGVTARRLMLEMTLPPLWREQEAMLHSFHRGGQQTSE